MISVTETNEKFLFTKLASQKQSDQIFINSSEKSYKLGRMLNDYKSTPETDIDALRHDKVSITPLTLDLTNTSLFNDLNKR